MEPEKEEDTNEVSFDEEEDRGERVEWDEMGAGVDVDLWSVDVPEVEDEPCTDEAS